MGKKSRLERAQSLHVRGRLAEAEALYREVLRVQPYQVEALEGLGVLTFHLGRSEEARALFGAGGGDRAGLGSLARQSRRGVANSRSARRGRR